MYCIWIKIVLPRTHCLTSKNGKYLDLALECNLIPGFIGLISPKIEQCDTQGTFEYKFNYQKLYSQGPLNEPLAGADCRPGDQQCSDSCTTVDEEKCETTYQQQCETVSDQKCETVYDTKCETAYEKQCR